MNGASTKAGGFPGDTDWERLRAMSDEEAEANALSDPDDPPLTEDRMKARERVPQVKIVRRALRLSQEEFARRHAIPLNMLRD